MLSQREDGIGAINRIRFHHIPFPLSQNANSIGTGILGLQGMRKNQRVITFFMRRGDSRGRGHGYKSVGLGRGCNKKEGLRRKGLTI